MGWKSVPRVLAVRDLVAVVAGPRSWSDTRESWLARAARRAGISYRQCKALFYAEITDPYHRSARLMRDAAERLEAAADAMAACDADRYRRHIDIHRAAAGELRQQFRPRLGGADQDRSKDRPRDDYEG